MNTKKNGKSYVAFKVATILLASTLSTAAFAYDVYLNWGGSDAEFQKAWDSIAGSHPGDLTATEIANIKAAVKTNLETAYNGFNVNFVTSSPGGAFQTLNFGNTTGSSGLFGTAFNLDWKNQILADTADVYVANFNSGNDILVAADSRASNINYLINAVSGTTAHEFGHDLGLQHYDCFCHDGNTYKGGYLNGTTQNSYIMATGSSGLTGTQRRTALRTFNTIEKVKMEFAAEIAPTQGKIISEVEGNDSFATAQKIEGDKLAVTGLNALVIEGSMGAVGDMDFYEFEVNLGSMITLNVFSDYEYANDIDSVLELYDSSMSLVASNDIIRYNSTELMAGGVYNLDSLILNYEADYDGTYYAKVRSFTSGDLGNYDLLVVGAVPEPGTMALIGFGAAALAARRRKKSA